MTPDAVLVTVHVFGLGVLIAGLLAFRRNRRISNASRIRALLALANVVLLAASFRISYRLDDSHRVVGFPFLAAVFERRGEQWLDFHGPMSIPAYIGNCLFALALPQLFLFGWRARFRAGSAT